MKYSLDDPIYSIYNKSGPFDHIEIELDGADIKEIIEEDKTDKIELYPEYAHLIEEASKGAIVHALGATFDAAIILGIDSYKAVEIMNKSIELLKERKLY